MGQQIVTIENYTIFYSWQSDSTSVLNKVFIGKALLKAIKNLNKQNKGLFECKLDRDTQGRVGSVNIRDEILKKIDRCDIFVADISFAGHPFTAESKKTPNPNVMYELGYALKVVGEESTVTIFNQRYGKVESLPFDIRQRRHLLYGDGWLFSSKKSVAKRLLAQVTRKLEDILALTVEAIGNKNVCFLSALSPDYDFNAMKLADFTESRTLKDSAAEVIFNFRYAGGARICVAIPTRLGSVEIGMGTLSGGFERIYSANKQSVKNMILEYDFYLSSNILHSEDCNSRVFVKIHERE